ncbi:hypothetical protein OIE13_22155 [Streptosporangium sp. NBC_01810]|uniref:hypothetical protein n=1 Tax=Streptosporangium sp. NBC_01810 TaxID=2975951 RepID=UPI002DDAFAB9|nr:hypothetical protein [Streptosporangium sp. NBC_01810]WSA23646.1 hypothetical protein OIE13_22155 [Streptosporangium sp. NBC_01810]
MTVFQPGDVVVSPDTGHTWWVHGHIGMELHLTSATGVCASIPDAEQRYGDLVLRYRSAADHRPVRSNGEHA